MLKSLSFGQIVQICASTLKFSTHFSDLLNLGQDMQIYTRISNLRQVYSAVFRKSWGFVKLNLCFTDVTRHF